MKHPTDLIGNSLFEGDLVRLDMKEAVGKIVELKDGGIIAPGGDLKQAMQTPGSMRILIDITVSFAPGALIREMIKVYDPQKGQPKPN